jgi:hypothetical protein
MGNCQRQVAGWLGQTVRFSAPSCQFAAMGTVTYTNQIACSIPSGKYTLIEYSDLPERFALPEQKGQLSSAETLCLPRPGTSSFRHFPLQAEKCL